MSAFKLTDQLVAQIEHLIEEGRNKDLIDLLNDLHFADIAEIVHELNQDEATYIIRLMDSEKHRTYSLNWTKMCVTKSWQIYLPKKLPKSCWS